MSQPLVADGHRPREGGPDRKEVEVAVGVLIREDGAFLLTSRPPGKVYEGYWEFPGGKVEPGETVREALVRELQEELGITATAATPWLTRQFTYPHATVRLNFWRVTAWEGEIGITAPLEHSAVHWMGCDEAPTVAPILPANDPILKALAGTGIAPDETVWMVGDTPADLKCAHAAGLLPVLFGSIEHMSELLRDFPPRLHARDCHELAALL